MPLQSTGVDPLDLLARRVSFVNLRDSLATQIIAYSGDNNGRMDLTIKMVEAHAAQKSIATWSSVYLTSLNT